MGNKNNEWGSIWDQLVTIIKWKLDRKQNNYINNFFETKELHKRELRRMKGLNDY